MRSRLDEEDNAAPEAYCGSTKINKLVIRKDFHSKLGQYSLMLPKLSSFMLLLNKFFSFFFFFFNFILTSSWLSSKVKYASLTLLKRTTSALRIEPLFLSFFNNHVWWNMISYK